MQNNACLENTPLFQATFNVDQGVLGRHDIRLQNGNVIQVLERMLESYLSFQIPIKYLNLCLNYEKKKVKSLDCIGELIQCHENSRQKLIKKHKQALDYFQAQISNIENLEHHLCFKKSTEKANIKWEFIPTNLHLQQMTVPADSTLNSRVSASNMLAHERGPTFSISYNIITVGAAADHAKGFKNGGIVTLSTIVSNDNKHKKKPFDTTVDALRCKHEERAFEKKLDKIATLFDEVNNCVTEWRQITLSAATYPSDTVLLEKFSFFRTKVEQFLSSCDDDCLLSPVRQLSGMQAKYKPMLGTDDSFHVSFSGGVAKQNDMTNIWDLRMQNVRKKLDDFKKYLDLFICQSLESFLQGGSSSETFLAEMRSILCEVEKHLKEFRSESFASQMIKEMAKEKNEISFELQCRRSAIFSQALSMCACAVVSLMTSSLHQNREALEQYANFGIFLQVESLLSTYGSEAGMIEDYAVAVFCLTNVTVKCVLACDETFNSGGEERSSPSRFQPWLEGSSDSPIIVLPFTEASFQLLPDRLQTAGLIQIVPVMFNVGINEEQALADTFGSSLLQESVNLRSLCDTKEYCSKYMKFSPIKDAPDLGRPSTFRNHSQQAPPTRESLHGLLRSLETAVQSKKKKNVEILRLSAAICRRVNGARVTSCKSAKDRTAMAVTLEQVRILQEEHGMDRSVFNTTLERIRRDGTRLENTRKNVGVRRYAFSPFQLRTFPRQYRAPEGTYGKADT